MSESKILPSLLASTLICFFSYQAFTANSCVIVVKFDSAKPVKTQLYSPINGYYNVAFETTRFKRFISTQDSLFLQADLPKPSFVTLYFTFLEDRKFAGRCDLLIFPGDSINIIFHASNEGSWITFSGSNAEAHRIFSEMNISPGKKFSRVRELIKNYNEVKSDFLDRLFLIIDSTVKPFDSLALRGIISQSFARLLRKNFKMLFFEDILHRFVLFPSKQLQTIEWDERVRLGNKLLKQLPVSDVSIRTLYNSDLYLETACKFFECKYSGLKSGYQLNKSSTTIITNKRKEIIDKELSHLVHIKDHEIKKNLWAFVLAGSFQFAPGYFNSEVINQYSRLFPSTVFNGLLRNLFESSRRPSDTALSFSNPALFLDSAGKMETFLPAINHLADSASGLFVDIWASWCAPCIEEFSFNKAIDSFLNENAIKKIYVSLDNLAAKRNWQGAIYKYKLGGYHILAGKKLQEQIQLTLSIRDNDPIPIPQYFIINKKGELRKLQYRPSSGMKLMSEILKLLK